MYVPIGSAQFTGLYLCFGPGTYLAAVISSWHMSPEAGGCLCVFSVQQVSYTIHSCQNSSPAPLKAWQATLCMAM